VSRTRSGVVQIWLQLGTDSVGPGENESNSAASGGAAGQPVCGEPKVHCAALTKSRNVLIHQM
jgi:hypothetical protein